METLKQLTIVESTAGMRVEGTVVFTPTATKGDSLPPGNSYPVQVGWDTDAGGLWTLYRVLSAEVRLDLCTMRVNGRIEGAGSAASFAVVRRRMVADWSSDLPTPVLLLDFLTGDPTDDQVWGAYATLTVAVAPAIWRDLRQTVRDAIDRLDPLTHNDIETAINDSRPAPTRVEPSTPRSPHPTPPHEPAPHPTPRTETRPPRPFRRNHR